jgi:signal transduction histidine kinase
MNPAMPSEPDTKIDLTSLVNCVLVNRADLVRRCRSALRKSLFTNRIEIRPGNEVDIAEKVAQALIDFLTSVPPLAREHGIALSEWGLSSESVFGLNQAHWDFFTFHFEHGADFLDLMVLYGNIVLEGYVDGREKMIRREQENIRTAFEITINRSNAKILEAQSEAQKATELSYRRVIMAQEEERRRISRELHDEAGQALIGINMSLENLVSDLPDFPSEKRERIEKAIYWTDQALQEIRSLAYSLRPPMLDLLGINLTIKQLCFDFSNQTGLIIRYTGEELPPLSDELSISLYRLVQEALTNVVKHAHAKHAWVKLRLAKSEIELSILDDGRGFDQANIQAGIGLNGMEERLKLLNGRKQIETATERSTLLKFFLPLIPKTN